MIRNLTSKYHTCTHKFHRNASAITSLYQSSMNEDFDDDPGTELLESDFLLYKERSQREETENLLSNRHHSHSNHRSEEDEENWISYWRRWQILSQQFSQKFVLLKDAHQSHSTHHIGKLEEQIHREKNEIHILTNDLKQLLQNMQSIVNKFESKKDSKLYASLSKKCATDWAEFISQFQKEQEIYLRNMDTMKQKKMEYTFMEIEQDIDDMNRTDEMIEKMYEKGFSDTQIEFIIQNRRDVIRRDKELSEIVESIVSLQELFTHLNALLVEQGSLLDRIDYHIESAHEHVRQARQNLESSDRHDQHGRKLFLMFIIIMIIVLIALIITIKLISMF